MRDIIETREVGPYTVNIVPDYDYGQFIEPAKEYWDQGIQFITWERNSTLSDLHNWTDKEAVARVGEKIGYVFNLYKYEHGQVAYNVDGFSCPWDSGQVGFVVIPKDAALNRSDAHDLAKSVCNEISDWCNGNYVGFEILDEAGNFIDSCGGFSGSDYDYALEVATLLAEEAVQEYYEKEARELEETRPDLYEVA